MRRGCTFHPRTAKLVSICRWMNGFQASLAFATARTERPEGEVLEEADGDAAVPLAPVAAREPSGHRGASGLALATALAGMVNGGILVAVLNRRLGGVEWGSVGRSAWRVVVACIPLVVACLWVAGAQVWTHPDEWMAKSVMLAVAIGLVGILIYVSFRFNLQFGVAAVVGKDRDA